MKLLDCPLNGLRNISEFSYGGEVHIMPDVQNSHPDEWAEYIYFHDNKADIVREWWCHLPSSYWFIAERDTRSNDIICTYPVDQWQKQGGK